MTEDLREQVAGWFDHHLRDDDDPLHGADPGTGFEFPAPTGLGGSGVGSVQGGTQTVLTDRYPGLDGADDARRRGIALSGPAQPVVTPAGGTPAAITSLPGLGSLGAALGGAAVEIPGSSPPSTARSSPRPSRWSARRPSTSPSRRRRAPPPSSRSSTTSARTGR